MITFLERGYAFYLMAFLCTMGLASKLLVRQAYSSLLCQTEDMLHATSEWLRQLKSRYESCFRKNGQVPNTKALVDKHLFRYRIFGLKIRRMEHLMLHTSVFCTLLTLFTTFAAYTEHMSMDMITRQVFVGLLFAGAAFLLDMLFETESRREILIAQLQDYFDNTLCFRLSADALKTEESKGSFRDDLFMKKEEDYPETRLVIRDVDKQTAATVESKNALNEAILESVRQSGTMTAQKEQLVEMMMKLVNQL